MDSISVRAILGFEGEQLGLGMGQFVEHACDPGCALTGQVGPQPDCAMRDARPPDRTRGSVKALAVNAKPFDDLRLLRRDGLAAGELLFDRPAEFARRIEDDVALLIEGDHVVAVFEHHGGHAASKLALQQFRI